MSLEFNDERYGELAHTPGEEDDPRMRVVSALLKPHRGGRLLDVGCMDGFLSRRFRREGFHTIGLDASARAIERAREVCHEAHVADFEKFPFPIAKESVDVVFAGEVLEHVFRTEEFLEELRRVTVPGGHMVLTTPNLACWINRLCLLAGWQPFFSEVGVRPGVSGNPLRRKELQPAGHIRLFTAKALEELLEQCGWEVVKLRGAPLLSRGAVRHVDAWVSNSLTAMACDLIAYCRKKPDRDEAVVTRA